MIRRVGITEGISMSDTAPFKDSERRPVEPDLSAQIAESIDREYGERVTCRRISGNKYRCNWWSPRSTPKYDNPRMEGLYVTTHVVVKSRFLRVSRTEKGLAIDDASARSESGRR
jgi:hypothetical protein